MYIMNDIMISNERMGSSFIKTQSLYMKKLINIYSYPINIYTRNLISIYKKTQHMLDIQSEYIRNSISIYQKFNQHKLVNQS